LFIRNLPQEKRGPKGPNRMQWFKRRRLKCISLWMTTQRKTKIDDDRCKVMTIPCMTLCVRRDKNTIKHEILSLHHKTQHIMTNYLTNQCWTVGIKTLIICKQTCRKKRPKRTKQDVSIYFGIDNLLFI
jgi:hypothetical protein